MKKFLILLLICFLSVNLYAERSVKHNRNINRSQIKQSKRHYKARQHQNKIFQRYLQQHTSHSFKMNQSFKPKGQGLFQFRNAKFN